MIVESGKFQDLQGESASWRSQRINVQFQSKGQLTWDTGKASVFLLAQREKKKNDFSFELASLTAQLVKNSPAMQETPVWFLGPEDPLEKG